MTAAPAIPRAESAPCPAIPGELRPTPDGWTFSRGGRAYRLAGTLAGGAMVLDVEAWIDGAEWYGRLDPRAAAPRREFARMVSCGDPELEAEVVRDLRFLGWQIRLAAIDLELSGWAERRRETVDLHIEAAPAAAAEIARAALALGARVRRRTR